MTLLQQLERERSSAREELRQKRRAELRRALSQLLPGTRVIVFGSLTKSGRFNEFSDIDLALETEPAGLSIYQLTARLMEEMGCGVDVVLLDESRFRNRILAEGEEWILSA